MKTVKLLTGLLVASAVAVSPVAMAKGGNGHGNGGNGGHGNSGLSHHESDDHKAQSVDQLRQVKKSKKYAKKVAPQKGASSYAKDDDNRLPPGLQMNAARGKALPAGWTKDGKVKGLEDLDKKDYTVVTRDGKQYVVLNQDVLDKATVISRPRDGVVQVKIDDRTVEVLEATRAVLNILR